MTPEDRRAAWDRSVTHKLSQGLTIDPRVLNSVEDWIAGAITAKVLRERYLSILLGKQPADVASDGSLNTKADFDVLLAKTTLRSPDERARTTAAVEAAWESDDVPAASDFDRLDAVLDDLEKWGAAQQVR